MDKEEERHVIFQNAWKKLICITRTHTNLKIKSVFVMNFGEGLDCFDEVNKTIYKPLRDWTVGCLDQLYTAIQPRLRHVYKPVTMHESLQYTLFIFYM